MGRGTSTALPMYGGDTDGACGPGCGVVFKLDTTGKETVLHSFTGGADGAAPEAGLIRDARATSMAPLYMAATPAVSCGTDRLRSGVQAGYDRKETVLYSFTGGADGECPYAGLMRDGAGNLYGTAADGGDWSCGNEGCGVVFKLTP